MKINFQISSGFIAVAFFFACSLAKAQPTSSNDTTSPFKGMNWRNIGPNRGGRSLGIAGSSKRKLEYYFGAVGGGLWKKLPTILASLPFLLMSKSKCTLQHF